MYHDLISALGVHDLTLNIGCAPINMSAIPGPGTWLLLSGGLLAIAAMRRRPNR